MNSTALLSLKPIVKNKVQNRKGWGKEFERVKRSHNPENQKHDRTNPLPLPKPKPQPHGANT